MVNLRTVLLNQIKIQSVCIFKSVNGETHLGSIVEPE